MHRKLPAIAFLCALTLIGEGSTKAGELRLIKEKSSVTYHLVHLLHKVNATSNDVEYQVTLDSTNHISVVAAEVDVTTFDSGNSNRDSHAMEVVDAITYPAATFASNKVTQSGDLLDVDGKLTFHGVTQDVRMAGRASWAGDTLNVSGSFPISLTQFKVDRPLFLMVPVQDTLWFDLEAAFQSVK